MGGNAIQETLFSNCQPVGVADQYGASNPSEAAKAAIETRRAIIREACGLPLGTRSNRKKPASGRKRTQSRRVITDLPSGPLAQSSRLTPREPTPRNCGCNQIALAARCC